MARNFDDDDDEDEDNPYESPGSDLKSSKSRRGKSAIEKVKGKVMAPAIGLMVLGGLGVIVTVINVVIALTGEPPPVDPNAPEFMKGFQQGMVGPLAATIQGAFVIVNSVIIVGAVQMVRFQSRPFAIVASVLAIVDIASGCCCLGIPIGIWSLIVLMSDDVQRAFESAS